MLVSSISMHLQSRLHEWGTSPPAHSSHIDSFSLAAKVDVVRSSDTLLLSVTIYRESSLRSAIELQWEQNVFRMNGFSHRINRNWPFQRLPAFDFNFKAPQKPWQSFQGSRALSSHIHPGNITKVDKQGFWQSSASEQTDQVEGSATFCHIVSHRIVAVQAFS
jgi:hypothetical protein